jgi:hypothetical protein
MVAPVWSKHRVLSSDVPKELDKETLGRASDRKGARSGPEKVVGTNVGEGRWILVDRIHPRIQSNLVVPYRLRNP